MFKALVHVQSYSTCSKHLYMFVYTVKAKEYISNTVVNLFKTSHKFTISAHSKQKNKLEIGINVLSYFSFYNHVQTFCLCSKLWHIFSAFIHVCTASMIDYAPPTTRHLNKWSGTLEQGSLNTQFEPLSQRHGHLVNSTWARSSAQTSLNRKTCTKSLEQKHLYVYYTMPSAFCRKTKFDLNKDACRTTTEHGTWTRKPELRYPNR